MSRYYCPPKTKVFVFLHTYPDRPNCRKTEKIGEYPYSLERFETKESVFRKAASHFGYDGNSGAFSTFIERTAGMAFDHSSLILPRNERGDYVEVAFYS